MNNEYGNILLNKFGVSSKEGLYIIDLYFLFVLQNISLMIHRLVY